METNKSKGFCCLIKKLEHSYQLWTFTFSQFAVLCPASTRFVSFFSIDDVIDVTRAWPKLLLCGWFQIYLILNQF